MDPYRVPAPAVPYRLLIGLLLTSALAVAVIGVLWLLRDWLTIDNQSLLFIVVIVLAGVFSGTLAALVAALVGFIGFSYLLFDPLFDLAVADPSNLIDLLVFVLVAVTTGQTTAYARRQQQQAQQNALRSATFEAADTLKTTLLRGLSHDLRTPITIIKSSAGNLMRLHDELTPDDRADLLRNIKTQADELDRMFTALLDLSRLEAGTARLNRALNSLEEVAGDAAARIYQWQGSQRVELDFPADLPMLPFDYSLLLQALTNLLDNAVRYEPSDQRVIVRGSINRTWAQIAVINHGPPITQEERLRIMQPFYRGADGHIGLGLPIVKGIVEAHGGRVWVDDTPGGGATFVIALPSAPPSALPTQHTQERRNDQSPRGG